MRDGGGGARLTIYAIEAERKQPVRCKVVGDFRNIAGCAVSGAPRVIDQVLVNGIPWRVTRARRGRCGRGFRVARAPDRVENNSDKS